MKHSSFILLFLIILLILFVCIIIHINESQYDLMLSMQGTLRQCRISIRLYYEQNDKYPESLYKLEEYANKYPNKMKGYYPPGEVISCSNISRSEHKVLDGTGGLFYDPNTGYLKINITKPLKSYWKLYFCEGRNEIPADW